MNELLQRLTSLGKHNLDRLGGLHRLHYGRIQDPTNFVFRLWDFYRGYCEGGFIERTIDTAQLLLAKPAASPQQLLGRFGA